MYAYFDIGGTKTRVAVSKDGKELLGEPVKFDTPEGFDEGIMTVASEIRTLAGAQPISAVGGGLAGPMNEDRTMLVNSPNLPGWVGKPFVEALQNELGAGDVFLENDSAIVALGEAHHGAGKGAAIMAYITVSTGVGGARIVDGRIDRSAFGFEPGHQVLDMDKTVFPILGADEAEEFLSGTATAKRFHKKAYEVTDPKVWEELARLLAFMLNNTAVYWSPHRIVLGGSMIVGNPAIPVDRAKYWLDQILHIYPEKPEIVEATLEDMGGIYGAMTFVAQKMAK
jgi:predicted NBD/HSP70 family sugar kinase